MITDYPAPSEPDTAANVAVLIYKTSGIVDDILGAAVARLRSRNVPVGGLLQRFGDPLPNGKNRMWVEDIVTGDAIRLDGPRGSHASGCLLDPDALAQAACLLRRTIEARPALVVVNRFGHAEAEGAGLRPEIAEAILSGAAVLIAAREKYLDALTDFLGAPPTLLPSLVQSVVDWAEQSTKADAGGVSLTTEHGGHRR